MISDVQALIGDNKLVGAVTLLAQRGEVKSLDAYGFLNRETYAPMPIDGIFRIYSMTKPITSVALMILVDREQVQLGDPICAYLPKFSELEILTSDGPIPSPKIPTIADILRHTAGFDYRFWPTRVGGLYREKGIWDVEKTLAETIDILATLPLSYEPGTSWQYSVAPDVSARIIEVVSGKSFATFLKDEIFTPLKMTDTGFYVPAEKQHRFAALYGAANWSDPNITGQTLSEAAQRGEHHLIASAKYSLESSPHEVIRGGTGLVSTAKDYFRFCQMILNRGELDGIHLLKSETVTNMLSNQLPPKVFHHFTENLNQPGQGFGYGFRVMIEKPDVGNRGEVSWWGAANTTFWIDPADEIIGIQMSQYMPPGIFPLGDAFKKSVYADFG